jgi:hypothetical protein
VSEVYGRSGTATRWPIRTCFSVTWLRRRESCVRERSRPSPGESSPSDPGTPSCRRAVL